MAKQLEKTYTRRIISLILLCVIICGFFTMRVFGYQVVNGDSYLADAQKSSYTTVKRTAARGEIVDRNGVPFTRNVAAFNLEFDYAFLKKGTENKSIFSLIKTFEALGEDWIDNLPITKTMPYEYLPDRDTDVNRLKNRLEVNTYATAQNCMDAIYEACGIKKYKTVKGKCSHCGEIFSDCDYEGYSEEYSRKIAGVRYEMMAKEFSSYTPRYTFAEEVAPATIAIIRELSDDFIGVDVVEKSIRTYVGGNVASHIIGTIGLMNAEEVAYYEGIEGGDYARNDTVGKSGVEKAFESELRGKNGVMRVVKNSRGDVIDVIETTAPVAGNTIKLTIDFEFQKEVQRILSDYITNFNETNDKDKKIEAGAISILDTKTGGVLASISYPYYDIEDYYKNYASIANAEGDPQFNRALNGRYRPGSTFKPVVAAGALAEGKIVPDTHITCTGVYTFIPNWINPPGCLNDGHRPGASLGLVDALKWSCNIFFYDTGRILGIEKMEEYANLFGLGVGTGLEIPHRKGIISSPASSEALGVPWEEGGDVIQAAIGQLNTEITPLEMAVEAMTIANKGTRYNAHLLNEVLNYDQTKVLQTKGPTIASEFDMTDAAFTEISEGMVAAGSKLRSPDQLTDLGYPVAVKTGTPQRTVDKTNNAFISFAPVANPEIAVACMLEDGDMASKMIRSILLAYEKSKTNLPK